MKRAPRRLPLDFVVGDCTECMQIIIPGKVIPVIPVAIETGSTSCHAATALL